MNTLKVLALVALPAFACTTDNPAGPGATPQAVKNGPAQSVAATSNSLEARECRSTYFHCFDGSECTPPALAQSTTCLIGRDYDISVTEHPGEVVVLSIAGGLIERNTTEIGDQLADRFSWSRYDLSGHGTDDCLDGLSNTERLGIAATRFNDPRAIGLVGRHHKAVALYGFSERLGYPRGTILVGGGNAAAVAEFIAYLNRHKGSFTGYTLRPIATLPGMTLATCYWTSSNLPMNIVNRVAGGGGGLQLQLDAETRESLVDPSAEFDSLRNVIYDSIGSAMNQ